MYAASGARPKRSILFMWYSAEEWGLLGSIWYVANPLVPLDRTVAILAGVDSIRDVIAFPKTQKGTCPLTDAPSPVDPKQLSELGVTVVARPRAEGEGTP